MMLWVIEYLEGSYAMQNWKPSISDVFIDKERADEELQGRQKLFGDSVRLTPYVSAGITR